MGEVVGWGVRSVGLGGLLSLVGGGSRLAVGEFVVLANVEVSGILMLAREGRSSTALTMHYDNRKREQR